MPSSPPQESLKSNIGLLLSGLSIALTAWFGVRADDPARPPPIGGSWIGSAEYIAGAVFFSFMSVVFAIAWSRRFWPSVRFRSLYQEIAQCRNEASDLRDAAHSEPGEHEFFEDLSPVIRYLHHMDELRAALRPLGVELHMHDADEPGTAKMHSDLRELAAAARVGNIRGARAQWRPDES